METKTYAEIKENLIEWFENAQNKITDLNEGSVISALLGSFASETEKQYLATKLGFVQVLRSIPYSVFDFKKKEGTYATGTVVFNRANAKDYETIIPVETEISGGGKKYITTETGTIAANAVNSNEIAVKSVEVGSENNIEANVINEIVSVLSSDVVGVKNNAKIGGGCDTESDTDMLKRFKDYLTGLQGTSKYGIKSACENVTGVRSVNVVEDFSSGAVYQVIVYAEDGSGNLASEVKAAIEDVIEGDGTSTNPGKRAPGINVLVTNPQAVPTDYAIKVVTYRADPEVAAEEIKNTVKDYVNGLGIGENVVLTSIMLKLRSLSYVRDVQITSPLINVAIANNQIARFDDAEITITEE